MTDDPTAAAIGRARTLVDLGRPEAALAELAPVLAAAPHHGGALLLAAYASRRSGRAVDAVTLADRAASVAPEHASVHRERAWCLSGAGRHAEAIDAADVAVRLAPDDADAHQTRAAIDVQAGVAGPRTDEHARAALALDPDELDHHLVFGATREALGDAVTARAAYEHVLGRRPEDTVARTRLARLDLLANRPGEAGAGFAAVARLAPTSDAAGLAYASLVGVFRGVSAVLGAGLGVAVASRASSLGRGGDYGDGVGIGLVQAVLVAVVVLLVVGVRVARLDRDTRRLLRHAPREVPLVGRFLAALGIGLLGMWVAVPLPNLGAVVVLAATVLAAGWLTVTTLRRIGNSRSGLLAGSRWDRDPG